MNGGEIRMYLVCRVRQIFTLVDLNQRIQLRTECLNEKADSVKWSLIPTELYLASLFKVSRFPRPRRQSHTVLLRAVSSQAWICHHL